MIWEIAVKMDEDSGHAVVNFELCMGCGVCVDMCPDQAIALRREPPKGEPLDVEQLKSQRQTA